jgi:hypothetical protein
MKIAVCAVFCILGFITAAGAEKPPRVFFLHSYDHEDICGQPQYDGALYEMSNSGFIAGKNFALEHFFMDTKRTHNTPEQIAEVCRQALSGLEMFNPDIIATFDDNAFGCVLQKYAGSTVSIVFSGLNGQPEDYNRKWPFMHDRKRPGKNVTGVYEKLHVSTALRVHSRLFPDSRKVIFLTDDSPTGNAVTRQLELELENTSDSTLGWEIVRVKSWEHYQQMIHWCNEQKEVGAIYPAALVLKDREGRTRTAPEIFKWTIAVSTRPEIALIWRLWQLQPFRSGLQ